MHMTQKPDDAPQTQMEAIINWILPGLTVFYRDVDLPATRAQQYTPHSVLHERAFLDVSPLAGKPLTNCRFVIASSKAAPMYKHAAHLEPMKAHVINCGSYFYVLDRTARNDCEQVVLLHIPMTAVSMFETSSVRFDQVLHTISQLRDAKWEVEPIKALQSKAWRDRVTDPVGMDENGAFFPLERTPTIPAAKELEEAVLTMVGDDSGLDR